MTSAARPLVAVHPGFIHYSEWQVASRRYLSEGSMALLASQGTAGLDAPDALLLAS